MMIRELEDFVRKQRNSYGKTNSYGGYLTLGLYQSGWEKTK